MKIFENEKSNKSEKELADSVVAREIVREILKYGVSQYQIERIIKFLSLELENVNMMKSICDIVEGVKNSTQENKNLIIEE
jgi:hypothetical protein